MALARTFSFRQKSCFPIVLHSIAVIAANALLGAPLRFGYDVDLLEFPVLQYPIAEFDDIVHCTAALICHILSAKIESNKIFQYYE